MRERVGEGDMCVRERERDGGEGEREMCDCFKFEYIDLGFMYAGAITG